MPELFLTSTATPRAFVHEMAKLLPDPVQRAEAAMAMMTLIESIWSWETLNSAISADMLHSELCGTDHGLGDMPMIAASELWLGWNSSAGTGAVASLAKKEEAAAGRAAALAFDRDQLVWLIKPFGRQGEDLHALFRNPDGVLKLGRQRPVPGHARPAVRQDRYRVLSEIDHRLHRLDPAPCP